MIFRGCGHYDSQSGSIKTMHLSRSESVTTSLAKCVEDEGLRGALESTPSACSEREHFYGLEQRRSFFNKLEFKVRVCAVETKYQFTYCIKYFYSL